MTRTFVALLLAALPIFAEEYTVRHFSGGLHGPGYTDATGRAARLQFPASIAADAAGNLYVADFDAYTIRRVAPDGVVTTLAGLAGVGGSTNGRGGAARFANPSGVAVDISGNVYVSDAHTIRKISPQGVVTTLANVSAQALDVDSGGNVFAASFLGNSEYAIRRITPQGTMTILDETRSSWRIDDVAVDRESGDLFYTPFGALYRRTPDGSASYVAGGISYVAVEPGGTLVTSNGAIVERVTVGGARTLIAGTGNQGGVDGPGPQASFLYISGLAIGPGGVIFVTESLPRRVRQITPDDDVSTIAGGAAESGHVDGSLADARFHQPIGIARDSSGNLYVADAFNRAVRKIAIDGTVSTLAGGNPSGHDDGNGSLARFFAPAGIAVDAAGNVYVTDHHAHTIRKITPAGDVTTLAGLGGMSGAVDGTGTVARFHTPYGIVVGPDGNLYVADSGNDAIRKITPAGEVTTFAGALDQTGNTDGTGAAARFNRPVGLTSTSDGSLYATADRAIRKITTPGAVVTTFAGVSGSAGHIDASGTAARFMGPGMIGLDSSGNLFVVDDLQLRKITPAAAVTTVAGRAHTAGNVAGTGELARFNSEAGICSAGNGSLYLVDSNSQNIRIVSPPGIADAAKVGTSAPAVHSVVTLGSAPDSATSWTWSVLRRPSGSTAQLSSTTAKNPTFTPDVADLFVMLLRAEGPAGVRYSTVSFTATESCEPLGSVVASIAGSPAQVCLTGTGATATSSVSGGGNETYQWGWRATSGGTITNIAGATSSSYPLEGDDFGGTTGTKYLVVTVTSDCAVSLVSNELTINVTAMPVNEISASSGVYADSTNNFASVPDAGAGTSYAWSITNGTITSGQGTRSVRYTAGSFGEVTLGVTINNGCEVNGQVYVPVMTRPAGASLLYLVTPCRVIDTRGNPVADGSTRTLTIGGLCGIPVGAKAIALNVTAVAPAATGYAALYPSNVPWPGSSTINYRAGRTRANNAVVPIAPDGTINLRNVGATTDFIIDVTGYFQ